MSENKNPQSAYQTLQNLLTDSMKSNVFGQGGLFGYRKENHEVLELFAQYSCDEIYRNNGNAPLNMDSESFIKYLNSQEKLSDGRKEEIAKKIQYLKERREIVDYPIEKNTLRNFAELLYELDIGRQPEKVTVKYELALEKALSLKPSETASTGHLNGGSSEAESKTASKGYLSGGPSEAKSETASTGYLSRGSSEAEVKANSEETSEQKAEFYKRETHEESTKLEVETGTEPEPEPEPEHSTLDKPEATASEPKTESQSDYELEKFPIEKPSEEISKESSEEKPTPGAREHLIIRLQAPVYQRLNLPKKSFRRINSTQSSLGNLRKAEKVGSKKNQSGSNGGDAQKDDQNQQDQPDQQTQQNKMNMQNSLRNIPTIPLRQKSKKKSLAQGMATATKWLAGAGVAAPLVAGGSSANAETISSFFPHFEKILKFLF